MDLEGLLNSLGSRKKGSWTLTYKGKDVKKIDVNEGTAYLEIGFRLPGDQIFRDRGLISEIYNKSDCSEKNLQGIICPDELARYPLDRFYSIVCTKVFDLFDGIEEDAPLGRFLIEPIEFSYVNQGVPLIQLKASHRFMDQIIGFRDILGLNLYNVNFIPEDYNAMKEWMPEDFQIDSPSAYEEIVFTEEDLKICRGVIGRPLTYDNIAPIQTANILHMQKPYRTHISGSARMIEPKDERYLVDAGISLLKDAKPDTRYGKYPLDHARLEKNIIDMLNKASKEDGGREKLQSLIDACDPQFLPPGCDAEYFIRQKDHHTLLDFYTRYINLRRMVNDSKRDPTLTYFASNLKDIPGGSISLVELKTRKPCKMNIANNSLRIESAFNSNYSRQVQDVTIRVNVDSPMLLQEQKKILEKADISFRG